MMTNCAEKYQKWARKAFPASTEYLAKRLDFIEISIISAIETIKEFGAKVGNSTSSSAEDCCDEFDEDWYLKFYPDIGAAVARGDLPSGLKHYLAHGRQEGRFQSGKAASAVLGDASLNRQTVAELQRAAVQHLPFLPYDIVVNEDVLGVDAHVAAPDGLTQNMAFFVCGHRFEDVQYPIMDENFAAKFSEIRGGGLVAKLKARLPKSASGQRFLRLDSSPTGVFMASNWRHAFHVMNPKYERFPVPPHANRLRVIGSTSEAAFKMGGATIFKNLDALLAELGYSWSDFPSILDWGCGAGRVTRYLISDSGQKVTGGDIDSDNVGWCRENLVGGRFETIPLMPKTQFRDEEFDLALGCSVFTHLKEEVQFAWLDELRRIIRPGGYAFTSVRGPTYFVYHPFPPHLYRKVQEVGFLDLSVDPALQTVIEDTEYYRAVFHSRDYICDRWSDYFEVVAFFDAIAALQDFVVLRRRAN
jgi:2-polyprenyl-3-methyl-5-hydroxy-6-metoxy-1,4-benzoquinol methylase